MAEVRAVAGAAVGALTAHASGIEITHYLWLDWGRIAQAQLLVVRAARAKVLAVRDAGGNWAKEMEAEHTGSLVTISACAHTLDGLYGELKPLVNMPSLSANASRHDHIRAVLEAAFKVKNTDRNYWKADFTWLHDLRDAAVHPVARSRPSVPHPIDGNGSYEAARYCLESCERAMVLVKDVLRRLASANEAKTAGVRNYGTRMDGFLRELLGFE
jgi:hypothetical protein